MSILSAIFKSKDTVFNDNLDMLNGSIQKIAGLFCELCENNNERETVALINEMYVAQKKSEFHTHKITTALSESFLTPFDKEDIYQLSRSLNHIAEIFVGTSRRIADRRASFNVDNFLPVAAQLQAIIANIGRTMSVLKTQRMISSLHTNCETIKLQILSCEKLILNTMFQFNDDLSPMELIAQQDIIQFTEIILERFGDVVKTLETFIVKYQ